MRNVAVGSLVTLILVIGLFVSQVEAKNNNNDDKGKDKLKAVITSLVTKYDKHDYRRSVPIPGTELLLGGGFAGLIAWRARQRQRRG